jgi:hypothetical protein
VVVHFVDIGGMADQHCLNFLFTIMLQYGVGKLLTPLFYQKALVHDVSVDDFVGFYFL